MNSEISLKESNTFNVCLLGAPLDVGNLGCCALAVSLVKLIIGAKPNARIYLLYGNRDGGTRKLQISGKTVEVNIANFRLSPRASLNQHLLWILFLACIQRITPVKYVRGKIVQSNRWLRTLSKADLVGEIRGGDSFSDIYGLRSFLRGVIPCIVAILTRSDLVMLPQTYGPYKTRTARMVARFVLSRAKKILARDKESIELIRELLGLEAERKSIVFCPDVAFILESDIPAKLDIQPVMDRREHRPLIGLNISSMLYVGGFTHDNQFGLKFEYRDFVRELLGQILKRTDAHILLVPHVIESTGMYDEVELCQRVRESLDDAAKERVHCITSKEYDQNEIKGIIGLCDFFVGARMHACIAAISQRIATVGLAYSKKFEGVFQSAGVGDCVVDMCKKDRDQVINAVVRAFEQRQKIADDLSRRVPQIQAQLTATFEKMLEQCPNVN